MSRVSLLNRDANIRDDIGHRINTNGNGFICSTTKDNVQIISEAFEELRKDGKSISSLEELTPASSRVQERNNVMKRVLRKKENGGYVLIGSLTCVGVLAVATLIFMAVKLIIVG